MFSLKSIKKIIEIQNFKYIYLIAFLSILLSIIETLSIGMIFPLLDYFANQNSSFIQFDFQNIIKLDLNEKQIGILIIFVFLFLFIIKFIFQLTIEWISSTFFNNLKIFVSEKMIKKHFSFKFKENSSIKNSSEFTNLAVVETERYCQKYIGGIINIFSESLTIIFITLMLFLFSTKYSILISLFYGFVILLIFIFIKNYLKKISFKRLMHHEYIMKISKEVFVGFKEIIVYMAKDKFLNNFKKNSIKLGNINRNESIISNLPRFLIELLTILIFSLVIFYIFMFSTISFDDVAPTLGLFTLSALRIYPGVTRILANLQSVKASVATEKRIIDYLNEHDSITNSIDDNARSTNNIINFQNKIELDNLSYKIEDKIIFKNLNLTFKKNQFIGIYGESGTGKSTLLNLLMGFIEPTNGKIIIDGTTLNNNNFNDWIKKIGFVGQTSFLLNDTIENNICLSSNKIDSLKLEKSIEQAQLSNFFNGDKNYKSFLTEHASNISGGEKQRFSIARAIYKNSDILFFDEPTSSLDSKTSDNFLEVVHSFYNKKTMFMVSHKIENLKNCDKILLIENSTVIEK